ncbi:MAG: transcriptional regulator [Acidimicrobiia bacterium]
MRKPPDFSRRLGERLRSIRKQSGLSLGDVERRSKGEFKASVVGAYERGERSISVPRLARLAEYYGVTLEELLPTEDEHVHTPGLRTPDADTLRLDLVALETAQDPEARIVERYVNRIRIDRGSLDETEIAIRREDIKAIAAFLDMDEEEFLRHLVQMGVVAGRRNAHAPR